MKIKSKKTAVETVVAKKTVRKAAKASAAAEKKVVFTVRAEPGKDVYVSGTFNQWNATGKKMADKREDLKSRDNERELSRIKKIKG